MSAKVGQKGTRFLVSGGGGWRGGWRGGWLVVGGRVERSGATFHPKNYYSPLVSCVLRLI